MLERKISDSPSLRGVKEELALIEVSAFYFACLSVGILSCEPEPAVLIHNLCRDILLPDGQESGT